MQDQISCIAKILGNEPLLSYINKFNLKYDEQTLGKLLKYIYFFLKNS